MTAQPICVPTTGLLDPAQVAELLTRDATAQRVVEKGQPPQPGDLVGVRLNLNVLKSTGQAIQTIHQATNARGYRRNQGFYKGPACGYAQAVVLRNAYFNVNQSGREAIASGRQHKFPMASVDGTLVSTIVPQGFEGIPVSFNPKSQHLFVDGEGHAIHSAEEVVILGHRAYARGQVVYHTEHSAPRRRGDAPSQTTFKPTEPISTSRRRAAP